MSELGGFIVIILLIAGVLFLLVRWSIKSGKKHQKALNSIGEIHGLTFNPDVSQVVDLGSDVFSWFKKGLRYDLENGMVGNVNGVSLSYFELEIVGHGKGSTHRSIFAVRSKGVNRPYFVLRSKLNQPENPTSFDDFFEVDADERGFIDELDDQSKMALVQVRLAAPWKNKWTHPAPYYIRVSGEWLVSECVFLAPESDTTGFDSCFNEALGYSKVLFSG